MHKTFKQADEDLKKAQKKLLDREIKAFLKDWKNGKVSVGSVYWITYRQYIK